MAYKTILVHLHDPARQKSLLSAAVELARPFDAHVIGLAVQPPIIVVPGGDAGPAIVLEEHRVAYKKDMVALKHIFASTMKGQTFTSEWQEDDAGYREAQLRVVDHGRTADLIIACQKDPKWQWSEHLEAPDRLIVESGRPVLLLPKSGEIPDIGKRIVVAWNGRRESARAVFDALPILKLANEVIVIWVNPQEEGGLAGELPGAEICATLARHGVKCDATQNIQPSANVGATLLSTVHANRADMLVMGCYGHSQTREFVFGGASRYVLENMSVPVLMSH